MSQANTITQSEYQKAILVEMGISCWQMADTSLLDDEVAQALAIEEKVAEEKVAEEKVAEEKVAEEELHSQSASSSETQSASGSGKSVLQQLSAQLGDKKEATPAEPASSESAASEPAIEEVEAIQEVDELLLEQLQGGLAQDIALFLQSIGRSFVTKPISGKVKYPFVLSDNNELKDSTSHYFSSQSLNQPQVKKRLWQLLQQS
ncbi:hypothetical protein [Planctobacterium marinum]|uniref:Uncharacterized protein n=1 Tax=Planctobacterium marinum TaxID=1631968 RepID=A0AA48KV79_9ALTE|nr:hypothetical protein MACH26_27560 [Planctobacterium marinum]